jgi:hypothetical protein
MRRWWRQGVRVGAVKRANKPINSSAAPVKRRGGDGRRPVVAGRVGGGADDLIVAASRVLRCVRSPSPGGKLSSSRRKVVVRGYTIEVGVGGDWVSDGGDLVGAPMDSLGGQTGAVAHASGPPVDAEGAENRAIRWCCLPDETQKGTHRLCRGVPTARVTLVSDALMVAETLTRRRPSELTESTVQPRDRLAR